MKYTVPCESQLSRQEKVRVVLIGLGLLALSVLLAWVGAHSTNPDTGSLCLIAAYLAFIPAPCAFLVAFAGPAPLRVNDVW